MNFIEQVSGAFRRKKRNGAKQGEETKLESLIVVIVPRTVLTKRDYKQSGVVNAGELGKYFHTCALDIGHALIDVYDDFFDVVKTEGDRKVEYVFRRGNQSVTYTILGIPSFESGDGQRFSSNITGVCMIQQPELDLQRAGLFVNAISGSHLLDYKAGTEAKFGIFYTPREDLVNKQRLEGIPLLKEMGIKPTEAAEFCQVMYFGDYRHKVFQEGELHI